MKERFLWCSVIVVDFRKLPRHASDHFFGGSSPQEKDGLVGGSSQNDQTGFQKVNLPVLTAVADNSLET